MVVSSTLKPVDGAQVTSSQRQDHHDPDHLMPLVASSRLQGLQLHLELRDHE